MKESVVPPLNPFDETPNDSPRNPFDEEISRKNPFDETPTPPRNPFDEEVKTPPIKLNPFDDTSEDLSSVESARNPFSGIPSSKKSSPEISPISISDSFEKLESAAEQKELKAKQQLANEPINDQNAPVEADIQPDDTSDETPERKRERSELMSMMQVYKTNPDEWNVFLMRFRSGIKCRKWCSNGTTHNTVLRLVEEEGHRIIEYDHKKVLVKRKPGRIDFDEISELRNVSGTNMFVIESQK